MRRRPPGHPERPPTTPRWVGTAVSALLLVFVCGCGQGTDSGAGAPADTTTSQATTTESPRPDPDELGDGTHQVRVDGADLVGGTMTVDGVEVMEGMEAVLAYLADTDGVQLEGSQVYVRNARSTPKEFTVDAAGSFAVIPADACCDPLEVGWSGFAGAVNAGFEGVWGNNPPFEVTIDGGVVTSARQIHIP
jgi:hypothetical protein